MNSNDGSDYSPKNDNSKSEKNLKNSIPWTDEYEDQLINILESQTENPVKIIHHIKQIKELFQSIVDTYYTTPSTIYHRPTIDYVMNNAFRIHNVTLQEIKGSARSKSLIEARSYIISNLYMAGYTFAEISRAIGKHQSTIKYTLERVGIIETEHGAV